MLGFYFSPIGRITRKAYWLKYVIPLVVVTLASGLADQFFFPEMLLSSDTGPVSAILNLVLLWPTIAVTTKRFHDRNMSGWWQLLFNAGIGVGAFMVGMAIGAAGGDPEALSQQELPMLLGGMAVILAAGGIELVLLGFLPGTKGRNDHGDDPLNPAKDVADVFS